MTDDNGSDDPIDQMHATERASVPFPVLPACPACANTLRIHSVDSLETYRSGLLGYVEFDCQKGHRFRWRFRYREHDGSSVESVRMLDVTDLQMVRAHVAWTAVREHGLRMSVDDK